MSEAAVGIVAYGAYLPVHRLERRAIGTALASGGGRGARLVAGFDEDPTSMGVEAARRALRARTSVVSPQAIYFATADPPYLDKTNATAIHAALDCDATVAAYDTAGAVRSGAASLRAAADAASSGRPALAVQADLRGGRPGSGDERDGADAAAAFLLGAEDVVAELLTWTSLSREFTDRFRTPGASGATVWEERFGEYVYVPLGERAMRLALESVGIAAEQVDHLVVCGPHHRATQRLARRLETGGNTGDGALRALGNAGAAQAGVELAAVLDVAQPGAVIVVVGIADGADVLVLRTTEALARLRRGRPASDAIAVQTAEHRPVSYPTFLNWRGGLDREPPRRPDPDRPASPPVLRSAAWKFAFKASRCGACGTRNLPPQRVCVHCHAVDEMAPESLADVRATVATYTTDHLTYSLAGPVVAAVVDFDGGGRYTCELTDVAPEEVRIGLRVEMTFRCVGTVKGVHNYFWKARPVREPRDEEVA